MERRETVDKIVVSRPDIARLDLIMPELGGIAATAEIRQRCPATQVIIFSMYVDNAHINQAFKAGASGYLLKGAGGSEIVQVIGAVHSGRGFVSKRSG